MPPTERRRNGDYYEEQKKKLKQKEFALEILAKLLSQQEEKIYLNRISTDDVGVESLEQKIQYFDQVEETSRHLENKDIQISIQQKLFQKQLEKENKKRFKKLKKIIRFNKMNCSVLKDEIEIVQADLATELERRKKLEKEVEYMIQIIGYLIYKFDIGQPSIALHK